MKIAKNAVIIFVLMFCVLSFFMFKNNNAYAENLDFSLNTNGYESGTWTNENVLIEIVYNGTDDVTYQYSINTSENWQVFDGEIEFSQEGMYWVYFSLATQQSTSMVKNLYIKLDKTNPTFELLSINNFFPTSEDVVLTVISSDGLSNVVGYKFGSSNWQEINTYIVTQNTTFEIGSILLKDGAGNVAAYNEIISITNIDKEQPIFNIVSNTLSTIRKDTITFQVIPILSGIDYFNVTLPNGEVIDITDSYADGFEITQNGEYIFTLKSKVGLTSSVSVTYNNISGNISNLELLIIICSITIIIIFGILFAPKLIKKIKLIKKNKNG